VGGHWTFTLQQAHGNYKHLKENIVELTAITNWSVTNMQHTDADGGVFLVYWSMVAVSDGTPSYSASEGGKLRCEP
jgi:hypothetical protein